MDNKVNGGVVTPPLNQTPVYSGGFKNLTHVIIYHCSPRGNIIIIKPSFFQLLWFYLLLVAGVCFFFYDVYLWSLGNTNNFWSMLFAGSILIGVGSVGLLKSDQFKFFMDSSILRHERNKIINYVKLSEYKFEQIDSLQVIDKLITTGKGISPFRSYELNLVFKSGERINLLHDNKLERLKKSVEELGNTLNISSSYIDEQVI